MHEVDENDSMTVEAALSQQQQRVLSRSASVSHLRSSRTPSNSSSQQHQSASLRRSKGEGDGGFNSATGSVRKTPQAQYHNDNTGYEYTPQPRTTPSAGSAGYAKHHHHQGTTQQKEAAPVYPMESSMLETSFFNDTINSLLQVGTPL